MAIELIILRRERREQVAGERQNILDTRNHSQRAHQNLVFDSTLLKAGAGAQNVAAHI